MEDFVARKEVPLRRHRAALVDSGTGMHGAAPAACVDRGRKYTQIAYAPTVKQRVW
jgi:hypothetical protein